MSERSPYEFDGPDPLFSIGSHVAFAVPQLFEANCDPVLRRADLLDDMKAHDRNAAVFANDITFTWEIGGYVIDDLCEGMAVAHKLLSFQASETGNQVPKIDLHAATWYFDEISANWETAKDYIESKKDIYNRDESNYFVDGLLDYINADRRDLDPDEVDAFLLGAISMYDLLHYQETDFNGTMLIAEYGNNSLDYIRLKPEDIGPIFANIIKPDDEDGLQALRDAC